MRIARWTLAAAAAAVMVIASTGRLAAEPPAADDADDEYRAELEAHGEALDGWRVDDGRSVSVMWDFSATEERRGIQPVVEVPSPGDYPWYSGSVAHVLDPNAVLTPEGLMVLVAAGDEPIASAEDTNPTDPQVKESTISYWWKRAAGGIAPPGPTLRIEPATRVVSIKSWPSHIHPGYEFVQVVVRFGPPCPAKVKGTLLQPPGGAEVVVKGIVISSVCGPTADDTSSADAQTTTPGGGGDGGDVDILPVTFRAGGAETVDGEADGDVIAVRKYCVYSIMTVQGTCPGFGVGSKLCIDCPASNSCPGPAGGTPSGFRFVDANGNLVCSGTWVKHYNMVDPSACIHCTNGRTGYVFVN